MCGEFNAFPLLPGEGRLGEEIRAFHEKNREGGGDFAFSSI
ncbi:hypothetical protein T4C_10066 [Trichinella pseudospiralis]|uniref:Uncharacterized protein n=1 Tax=Trichinella pseudospiralis TaxID=6337 RepID=A0A0V1GCS2_TRIPS|nr:hypothetical protein T4D_13301 [Trichinella pseudospiralis]KRY96074.1 hypothetical protein T4C_10066 [Trichinella pseudospiralis]